MNQVTFLWILLLGEAVIITLSCIAFNLWDELQPIFFAIILIFGIGFIITALVAINETYTQLPPLSTKPAVEVPK